MHATRAAVEEGIVPGGGVALARAGQVLAKLSAENDEQRFGIEIVRKALQWSPASDRGECWRGRCGPRGRLSLDAAAPTVAGAIELVQGHNEIVTFSSEDQLASNRGPGLGASSVQLT